MAHAARAAAEASRKASLAAANASLSTPEPVDVFNYEEEEKGDAEKPDVDVTASEKSSDLPVSQAIDEESEKISNGSPEACIDATNAVLSAPLPNSGPTS